MSLEPVSFRKMDEQTDDIYEAVVVMSIRSKQILRDRLIEAMLKEEEEIEMGIFDEIIDPDSVTFQEIEKETTVAIDEFLKGELSWKKNTEDANE
tara:strand:+ start:111 stop:395 length:285 start_codon:yes stop_codon:yes gene_type:complete